MQHDDFKAQVQETFDTECWDVPRAEHLARRCEIAWRLFQAEPEGVKERIRLESKEEHEEELARWKEADEGLPSLDPHEQAA
jgi:hypothetical protein